MRAAVHLAAALALAALAFAAGRWLRDPSPGGSLLILLGAAILWVVAVRRLYGPGGLGRAGAVVARESPDDRVDLKAAGTAELQRLPGIGPVGALRIVEEREAVGERGSRPRGTNVVSTTAWAVEVTFVGAGAARTRPLPSRS